MNKYFERETATLSRLISSKNPVSLFMFDFTVDNTTILNSRPWLASIVIIFLEISSPRTFLLSLKNLKMLDF